MINDANPLASEEIENEPFHRAYKEEFGPEDYQKKMDRLAEWKKMSKRKGGQPEAEFEAQNGEKK
jgi:hypothetical protein